MFISKPIGVFDSGIGGLNVLRELQKLMPYEDYVYLADTKNAPYGNKSAEEILSYSRNNVKRLVDIGCKAIVIACNTATAVAAEELRREFLLPIFGIEPAVKPAAEYGGNVLVLTTERTAKEERFKRLVSKCESISSVKFYVLPVQELVALVEQGKGESYETECYLIGKLKELSGIKFSSCVLGCTHFPLAKKSIENAIGYTVKFFDGSIGTAKNVEGILKKEGMCKCSKNKGELLYLWTE